MVDSALGSGSKIPSRFASAVHVSGVLVPHSFLISWLALTFFFYAPVANIRALIEHVLLVPASFLVGQQLYHADLLNFWVSPDSSHVTFFFFSCAVRFCL